MITVSYMTIAHPEFQRALGSIIDCAGLDQHTSYRAGKIWTAIENANKDVAVLRKSLCEKHAVKDETGKIMSDERGMVKFESPAKAREFESEFTKEFESRSVTIKVNKLDFAALGPCGISPRQWGFIESIVENLPGDEEEPTEEEPGNIVKLPTRKS